MDFFARWLIEASGLPALMMVAVCESHLLFIRGALHPDSLSIMYMMVYISKFILWMTMRYIELYPSSKIRNYPFVPVFHFCKIPSFH